MKLLMLTRYDRLGASSRLRMMQYIPWLSAAGIKADVQPLLTDEYLRSIYSEEWGWFEVLASYARRLRALSVAERWDVIWLEKEFLPWTPGWVERIIGPCGIPVVTDYDDAVFHNYDLHQSRTVRVLLGNKIDGVMSRSAMVTGGNPYLARRAREAGTPRIEIVPTVVDSDSYHAQRLASPDNRPRIGWIGSPSTWTQYMSPMLPMLTDVARQAGATIRVVGAGTQATGVNVENFPWSEESESRLIQGMDVGLMPLDDTPWSQGKCGYKIIQYMACGVPVVASPVGVNAEIIEDGVTGFLATSDAEWRTAISRLLTDPELRLRMGIAGRRRMEERYSLQVWGPRVATMLLEVAAR